MEENLSQANLCVFNPPSRFLLQCLDDLDSSLRKLNSRLFVIRGQPANVFPQLFKVKFIHWQFTNHSYSWEPILELGNFLKVKNLVEIFFWALPLCFSLLQEWEISRLTFEYDSEPFGKERDAAIKKLAMEAGVEVIVKISHTLYNLDKYELL